MRTIERVHPAEVPDSGGTIAPMTTREKAHALLDELSDAELDEVVRLIEVRHEESAEPEMAELPESWKTFEDGTPVPNWVAALDEARQGR
jgi:hypothetical protein